LRESVVARAEEPLRRLDRVAAATDVSLAVGRELADHCDEQRLLRAEVVVNEAVVDAGPLSNLAQRHPRRRCGEEQLGCRRENCRDDAAVAAGHHAER
jgi:hypothetical protein